MKRTRKWAFIGQEAQRLFGLGMSLSEIGRQLDVQQSTVSRWVSSGKLTKPKAGKRVASKGTPPKAPAQWAASVRETYALDPTDEQLVTTAQQALEVAYNMAEGPTTRLSAMGRFQSVVKQLALGLSDRKTATETEQVVAVSRVPMAGRVGSDPRSFLQVVK